MCKCHCEAISEANMIPEFTIHGASLYNANVHVNIYITFTIHTDIPPSRVQKYIIHSGIVCSQCEAIYEANILPDLTIHLLLPCHADIHVNSYIFTDIPPPTAQKQLIHSGIFCSQYEANAKADTLPDLAVHLPLPCYAVVHLNIYITFTIFTDIPLPTAQKYIIHIGIVCGQCQANAEADTLPDLAVHLPLPCYAVIH